MPTEPEQFVSISRYDFLVVFIGILVGLSVGKLVSFIGHLVSSRQLQRLPLAHGTLLVIAFLFQVHYWWKLWDARAIATGTFLMFLQLLLLPLLLYLAIAVLCPKPLSDAPGTLERYFSENSKGFYTLVMAILIVGGVQGVCLWNQPYQASVLRGVGLVLVLLGFFTSSRRLHAGLTILLLVLFLVYMFGADRFAHALAP
jgi:hypothetical protein